MMNSKNISTKDLILDTVFSLQSEDFFSKISLSKIAERVGISKTAIFRHFKNKDELMSEAESRLFDIVADLLLDVQDQLGEKDSTIEKVFVSVCRVVSYFMEHTTYFLYLLKLAVASQNFETRFVLEMKNRGIRELITFYSKVDETGNFVIFDKRMYVRYIYAFSRTAFILLACSKNSCSAGSVAEKAESFTTFLFNGFGHRTVSISEQRRKVLDETCRIDAENFPEENRIFLALASVIGKAGVTGITIQKLADELGLAKSSLYSYFSNKNELIRSLIAEEFSLLMDTVKEKEKAALNFYEMIYIRLRVFMTFFILRPSIIPVSGWLRLSCDTASLKEAFRSKKITGEDAEFRKLLDEKIPGEKEFSFGWFMSIPVTLYIQGRTHEFTNEDLQQAVTEVYGFIECGIIAKT
ncbi:MAG: TetR/AcrR family transcriptional regulator [Treponema sp.]|jgi:AcrR family transcriptional regulator|nr:TetR/AcrR family transcriptional regulator [Treponema sp.]